MAMPFVGKAAETFTTHDRPLVGKAAEKAGKRGWPSVKNEQAILSSWVAGSFCEGHDLSICIT